MNKAVDHDLRPTKAHNTDAAWDLRAASRKLMANNEIAIIPTGIRLELPTGYVGLVHSRSGFAKKGIIVANAPGVIDAGYRGEIGVILMNLSGWPIEIYKGDRIAQLIIQQLPNIKLQLVNAEDFNASDTTERGTAGFGSTGNC